MHLLVFALAHVRFRLRVVVLTSELATLVALRSRPPSRVRRLNETATASERFAAPDGIVGLVYCFTNSEGIIETRLVHMVFRIMFSLSWVVLRDTLFGRKSVR